MFRLEFAAPDVDGAMTLVVPSEGPLRYELVLSGAAIGAGFVVVRADDIPRPRHDRLEFRGDGIWTECIEEAGDGHWSFGLEAFGLRVDDPAEDIGDRIPVGYDLEFERLPPASPQVEPPARLHGDLLIGTETIVINDATATLQLE